MYKRYKIHLLVLGISVWVLLTGCSQREKLQGALDNPSIQSENTVEEALDKATTESEEVAEELLGNTNVKLEDVTEGVLEGPALDKIENTKLDLQEQSSQADVDIDLTKLSSTMVYAEVYNMMVKPEDYMGKTIKMKGLYTADHYDATNMYYHYILIEDAMACCQSGIEFVWDNNTHQYPEEYPEIDAPIQIVGTFGSYEELGQTYYYLAVDEIEK